jgi:hypothetical protein
MPAPKSAQNFREEKSTERPSNSMIRLIGFIHRRTHWSSESTPKPLERIPIDKSLRKSHLAWTTSAKADPHASRSHWHQLVDCDVAWPFKGAADPSNVGILHWRKYMWKLAYGQYNNPCITGWWYTYPPWKICSSDWIIIPTIGENKKWSKPPTR